MARSPVSILFSTDGVEIAVKDATSLPTNARGQILVGLDGSTTRFVNVNSSGHVHVVTEVQLDFDTGAGTQNLSLFGIGLPASGGAVAGGTITNPIRVDPTGTTTQPISGTVTANIGTTNGLALDATLTGGTQRTRVTDGTNNVAVKAASTAAVAADPSFVVALSPNSPIPTGSNVIGAVTQSGTWTNAQGTGAGAGAPWSVRLSDGSAFYNAPTASQLPAALVGGRLDTNNGAWLGSTAPTVGLKTSANSIPVVIASDQGAVPVSGTVTSNIGTTNGLALDATLTGGTQKAINRGGAKGATAAADVTSTAEGTDHQALDVQIYHGGTAKDPTAIRALTSSDVVTSAQGTAAATAGAWPAKVTDGTNVAAVKAASTAAVASDPALVVAISPNNSITVSNPSVGSNNAAIPTSSTQVGGSDGTNLQVARVFDADSGAGTQYVLGSVLRKSASGGSVEAGTSSDPLRVDPTGTTTQPVSGTVTVNQGTAAALSGFWPVKVTDGTNTMPTGDSAARGVFHRVTDGTNTAAVKAASTAAVAADPALVVAVSPNSILQTSLSDPNGVPLWSTPFGELRATVPWTLADLINKYEIDPRLYSTQTATGGTVVHVPLQSAIQVSATGTNGSSSKLRTNTFFRYQAGKSLRWRTTVYQADAGQANQVRRWGFFDDNDGIFFQLSGTTLSVVQRSSVSGSVVDTVVNQASWNYDKMNGTGVSGVTIDITKANIYEGAFQWLGVGIVQLFINGRLAHTFQNPNVISFPYMRTAQLPMSWEIVNTGASTASSLTYICASVHIEGGDEPQRTSFAAFNSTDVSVTTTERPILSIRPKITYNSITNRMLILPFLLSVSTEGSRSGFRVVMNSTLTGASWSSADSNSGVEIDTSATSGTGGQTLLRGFLPASNDSTVIPLGSFFSDKAHGRSIRLDAFAANQDVLTVYAINEAAGTTLMRASVSWDEVR